MSVHDAAVVDEQVLPVDDERLSSVTAEMQQEARSKLPGTSYKESDGANGIAVEMSNNNGNHLSSEPYNDSLPAPTGTPDPPTTPEPEQTETYRLSYVSKKTGLSPQHILNIIERYNIIDPQQDAKFGERSVYAFYDEHLDTLFEVAHLLALDYSISEVEHLMTSQPEYSIIKVDFFESLDGWRKTGEDEDWNKLVDVISQLPSLTNDEKLAFSLRRKGFGLYEIATELKTDIKIVRRLLKSAHEKVGEEFWDMLGRG